MATRRTSEVSNSTQKTARRSTTRSSKHSATAKSAPAAEVIAAAPVQAQAVPTAAPSNEEIARLAFTFWEQRGRTGGSPEQDWLRAERELLAR